MTEPTITQARIDEIAAKATPQSNEDFFVPMKRDELLALCRLASRASGDARLRELREELRLLKNATPSVKPDTDSWSSGYVCGLALACDEIDELLAAAPEPQPAEPSASVPAKALAYWKDHAKRLQEHATNKNRIGFQVVANELARSIMSDGSEVQVYCAKHAVEDAMNAAKDEEPQPAPTPPHPDALRAAAQAFLDDIDSYGVSNRAPHSEFWKLLANLRALAAQPSPSVAAPQPGARDALREHPMTNGAIAATLMALVEEMPVYFDPKVETIATNPKSVMVPRLLDTVRLVFPEAAKRLRALAQAPAASEANIELRCRTPEEREVYQSAKIVELTNKLAAAEKELAEARANGKFWHGLSTRYADYVQAVGMLATLKGDMQVDVDDPLDMARQVHAHVNAELAALRAASQPDAEREKAIEEWSLDINLFLISDSPERTRRFCEVRDRGVALMRSARPAATVAPAAQAVPERVIAWAKTRTSKCLGVDQPTQMVGDWILSLGAAPSAVASATEAKLDAACEKLRDPAFIRSSSHCDDLLRDAVLLLRDAVRREVKP